VNFVDPDGYWAIELPTAGVGILFLAVAAVTAIFADDSWTESFMRDVQRFANWALASSTATAIASMDLPALAAEHTRGARPSTLNKHQQGQSRNNRDQGGERADSRRNPRTNSKRRNEQRRNDNNRMVIISPPRNVHGWSLPEHLQHLRS